MKLSQLRTFVAIADGGGFARAASRLRLTQSAASRQISALEQELDVLLFDRIGRRVLLTSDGDDLLKRARKLLADADALEERARVLKGGQSGTLRVSARPQVIENLLAPFLPRYLRGSPGVDVQLIETSGSERVSQLDRGEIHLALMAYGVERFESEVLYPIHVLAVTSLNHRLARKPVIDISEIADEPLLVPTHAFGARSWFDAACENAHVSRRVILESGSPQTIMALARVGYGVAIVPSNVHSVPSRTRAIPLVHRGSAVGRWSIVAWNPQRFLAPYARRFVDELAEEAMRAYPGHDLIRRAPPLPRPK